jgi:putative transposase
MAKTEHYYTPFEPDCFYHIYNRTVDLKPMFTKNENYHYFLKRYSDYLSGVVDTYAYCLLGNHFHLLVRVKSQSDLAFFQKLSNQKSEKSHDIVSHQFQKFSNRMQWLSINNKIESVLYFKHLSKGL